MMLAHDIVGKKEEESTVQFTIGVHVRYMVWFVI